MNQRTGPLREHKAQQPLVLCQNRWAAHHVAHVLFGQIVVRQIQRLESLLAQCLCNVAAFALVPGGQAHKHMGTLGVSNAVVEFGDVAWPLAAAKAGQVANQLTKAAEAAALFGNGDGKQGFALLAHLGPLGHKAQAIKVHVGTAQNGGIGFALGAVLGHVLLDGGHGQCACRFHNAAGIDKNVFDGGTHGIGIHRHEPIDQPAGDAEGFFAHQLHSGAVREQAHIRQCHPLACGHRLHHGIGVVHLNANHLDLGPHGLDVIGHAGDEPATADGHKHRIQLAHVQALELAQYLHRHRTLAGNHIGVVKWVDKGQPFGCLQVNGMVVGIGVAVTVQHHFATEVFHGIDLELGRGGGHHDHGPRAQLGCAQGHTLGVVARRGANHSPGQLFGTQVRHFVVRPAQLETEDGLQVFAFEQHGIAQPLPKVAGRVQFSFLGHVVHTGVENPDQVILGGEGKGRGGGGRGASSHHKIYRNLCRLIGLGPVATAASAAR